MKVSDLIIELFYHVGGLSLLYLSIKTIQYSWRTGAYPTLLGVVVLGITGYYVGDTVRNMYSVIVKKEKYPIGLNV